MYTGIFTCAYSHACIAFDNKLAIVCTVGGPSLHGVTSETAEFNGGHKPDCLVDQCEAVAFLGLEPGASAQALAACQDMCALLKQPDEIEHRRTLLKKRIDTLAKALQVPAAFKPPQQGVLLGVVLWSPVALCALIVTFIFAQGMPVCSSWCSKVWYKRSDTIHIGCSQPSQ